MGYESVIFNCDAFGAISDGYQIQIPFINLLGLFGGAMAYGLFVIICSHSFVS